MKKLFSCLAGFLFVFTVVGSVSALTIDYMGAITDTTHSLHEIGDKVWVSLTDDEPDALWDSVVVTAEFHHFSGPTYSYTSTNITDMGSNIWEVYDNSGIRLWTLNLAAPGETVVYDYKPLISGNTYTADLDLVVPAPVPEPATMLLFGLGILGLAGVSRKKLVK